MHSKGKENMHREEKRKYAQWRKVTWSRLDQQPLGQRESRGEIYYCILMPELRPETRESRRSKRTKTGLREEERKLCPPAKFKWPPTKSH